jgi:hypothetical protein
MVADDFFRAIAGIDRQTRRLPVVDEENVQEYVRSLETITLTDAAPERDDRGSPYFTVAGNDLLNPNFETESPALQNWTEDITATGSTARDTSQAKTVLGSLASLKLSMTNAGASGQHVRRYQDITTSSGVAWSIEAWVHITAISNATVRLRVEFLDGADAVLQTNESPALTAITSVFQREEALNVTAPASTAKIRVSCRLASTAVGATGTAYFDLVRAEQSATLRDVKQRIVAGEWKVS